MTGWQDSFQPAADSTAMGGWQSSFQLSEPDAQPESSGAMAALAAPMDAASRGGAQLISNIMAPFSSEQTMGKLRTAGLYDVQHPEIANPFIRGVAESPLGSFQQAEQGAMFAPLAPVMNAAQQGLKNIGVPQGALDAANMAGTIMSLAGPPNPTKKTSIRLPNEAPNSSRNIFLNNQGAPPQYNPANVPAEFQGLSNLPAATKGTTFGAPPKSLQMGIDANQKISQAYETASKQTSASASAAKSEGSDFVVTAPDLYKKLNSVTQYLSDKVAPGTKEQAALAQLQDMQSALNEKYGIPKSGTPKKPMGATGLAETPSNETPAMSAYGVSPADLLDLRQAINAGLSGKNIVKAGGASLLDFKNYVNGALDTASQIKPSFGEALKKYNLDWANQAGKFLNNKELDPFWKQEDYIAWKAKQNNPAQPGFTPGTQSRAATFLDNLNTPKAGRVASISQVLPKEYATQLLKSALINTKKEPMGVGQIISDVHVTKPLKTVAQIARKIINPVPQGPLLDLAGQIKRMGTK